MESVGSARSPAPTSPPATGGGRLLLSSEPLSFNQPERRVKPGLHEFRTQMETLEDNGRQNARFPEQYAAR